MKDSRSPEELQMHYELERRLAALLRGAPRGERLRLYRELYDELYRAVPFLKTDPKIVDEVRLGAVMRLLGPFLSHELTVLEIGAGNLALARAMAPHVKEVIALDVSKEFAMALGVVPANVAFVLSDGLSVPVPPESVDLVYSDQLMEHLHPDDAFEQLQNILRALKPGGRYICNTPHRFNGPHDISQYFDQEATGFHLKEYTNRELHALFLRAGFRSVYSLTGVRGFVVPLPVWPLICLEFCLSALPKPMRRLVSRFLPIKVLLGVRLVGVK
jgi:SAM-dependent methyltransferase